MKILVVDDDKEIVELLSIYIQNEGYEVEKAYNGKEALTKIKTIKNIDLMVLDVMMPNMDGNQVVKEVRKELLTNTEESDATIKLRSKKFKQLDAIVKCFEQAYYPNKKITRQRKKKDKYLDPFKSVATEQLASFVDGSTWVENSYWNLSRYDIENEAPHLYYQYPSIPNFDDELYSPNSRKPRNIEEYIDTLERPLIVSLDLPDKKVRYMQPLQRIEKNVHHSYISQRELELNSNVRTLSVAGLKQVFGRLAIDSHRYDYKYNKAYNIFAVFTYWLL